MFACMNKHFPPSGVANVTQNADKDASADKPKEEETGPTKTPLSSILRKHVTETVLYMLKTFPFCSISHQQSILIMQSLGESYDQEDLAILKDFVRSELDRQARFKYPMSGNATSGMNMG